MSEIQIISKESHKTLLNTTDSTTALSASQPAVVLIKVPIEDVAQVKRDGTNAVVFLKNGEQIVIQNFFANDNNQNLEVLLHKDLKCKAPLIEPNLRRNLGKWST
ncbi:BapA/Bap/LapF family prefix-like domain-containing protein [Acinetobacter haemolyticus]|uniref:BapA prefix-like domain-containing protein n=1 Tax=Acinetobacter haemolyticus TaxID=29430 RepID=A0AAJ2YTD3_ACIHA|nr:BapA prefix-like domain-containing protein [Acinetobacter haemolyticus]NAR29596.1 BapA prefix-like domain-containing protein [Acinetobacter haemolyticus]NAR63721.1 BapA prefix-like domain-containing protein [Acinetobacter haemolyticus]NAR74205.1 BapA prefix-like domain-containing protein [Acinetobacter haemolyticus]NAR76325.1 BapA prefix-like domain-containing protein [Acinetobacter haemolyticus]NAR78312.1 BapA prefix-like domain-containing protein [Acinetobacter haemolyticus]